jgi:hypothetical protein
MRRIVALILLSIAVSGGGGALGQSAPVAPDGADDSAQRETPDEVIVRGRRLTELRFEVQEAREHAYAIFNEINSDDDFDVRCRDERRYHSRAKRRVCRAQFENRIAANAAKEYMAFMHMNCPSSGGDIDWQGCMFSGIGQQAAGQAKAVEGQALPMHDRMNDEILRLARTDLRFGQAILDFFEASQEYEATRERRED